MPGSVASSYDEGYAYGSSKVPRIKFRSQYSNSGMSLADAINGVRPAGADRYKWHELHADRNGEIYLRVAVSLISQITIAPRILTYFRWNEQWNGYRAITYRVPVDWFENRIRMSSLCRRVGRAIVHYLRVCLSTHLQVYIVLTSHLLRLRSLST